MKPFRSILLLLPIAVWSPASAETMKFEDAAALLGTSCAKDIDTNCRGVNLDPPRPRMFLKSSKSICDHSLPSFVSCSGS